MWGILGLWPSFCNALDGLQHRHGPGHGADAPHQHGAAAEAARKTELEAQMSSAEDAEYEEVGDGETA